MAHNNDVDLEILANLIDAHEVHFPHGEGDVEHCRCNCGHSQISDPLPVPHPLHRAGAVAEFFSK